MQDVYLSFTAIVNSVGASVDYNMTRNLYNCMKHFEPEKVINASQDNMIYTVLMDIVSKKDTIITTSVPLNNISKFLPIKRYVNKLRICPKDTKYNLGVCYSAKEIKDLLENNSVISGGHILVENTREEVTDCLLDRLVLGGYIEKIKPFWFTDLGNQGLYRVTEKEFSCLPGLYVSLTSIISRQVSLLCTLESMLNQTVLPDKIFIHLSEEGFPGKRITYKGLERFIIKHRDIIEVVWVKDIRSYGKLLPIMKQKWDEDCLIITIDDDVYYNKSCIYNLVKSHCKNPETVVCLRCKSQKNLSSIEEFDYSKMIVGAEGTGTYLFPSGTGGVLYRPKFFHKTKALLFREDIFMNTSPTCDDSWFYVIRILNGVSVTGIDYNYIVYEISNDIALHKVNMGDRHTDAVLDSVKLLKGLGYKFT